MRVIVQSRELLCRPKLERKLQDSVWIQKHNGETILYNNLEGKPIHKECFNNQSSTLTVCRQKMSEKNDHIYGNIESLHVHQRQYLTLRFLYTQIIDMYTIDLQHVLIRLKNSTISLLRCHHILWETRFMYFLTYIKQTLTGFLK